MSTHDVNCGRTLRVSMLAEAGDPADPPLFLLEAIAAEIVRCCGHRALKGYRLANGWTVERAVAAFHEMCRVHDLGARGLTVRSWLEWEAGEYPNADYQDLLCRLFQTDPVSLGFSQAYGARNGGSAPEYASAGRRPPETGEVMIFGAGLAVFYIPTTVASVYQVPPDRTGVASALVNVTRTVGGAVGLAVISTVVTSRINDQAATGHPASDALTSGFRLAFAITAALIAAAAVLALIIFRNEGRGEKIDFAQVTRAGIETSTDSGPVRPLNVNGI